MKQLQFMLILSVLVVSIVSCSTTGVHESNNPVSAKRYNIVIILDGTDRLVEENCVPMLQAEDIMSIANNMTTNDIGTIYVSWVDDNSDNNQAAVMEYELTTPNPIPQRPNYVPVSKYNAQIEQYKSDSVIWANEKRRIYDSFRTDCNRVIMSAYSEKVAKAGKGSDINGSLNQALRLLSPNAKKSDVNIILLISDGVDNGGKELAEKPENIQIILLNGNVAKHSYGDFIDNEFVTLNQAINHIFK